MASRLNGRSIPMLECLFEKNGKCVKLDKNEQKKEPKNVWGRKCQLFWGIGCNVLELVR